MGTSYSSASFCILARTDSLRVARRRTKSGEGSIGGIDIPLFPASRARITRETVRDSFASAPFVNVVALLRGNVAPSVAVHAMHGRMLSGSESIRCRNPFPETVALRAFHDRGAAHHLACGFGLLLDKPGERVRIGRFHFCGPSSRVSSASRCGIGNIGAPVFDGAQFAGGVHPGGCRCERDMLARGASSPVAATGADADEIGTTFSATPSRTTSTVSPAASTSQMG